MNRRHTFLSVLGSVAIALGASLAWASGGEKARHIDYPEYPPAPASQSVADAEAKSTGCNSCHLKTDQPSMHANPGVILGCTDCHGGLADVHVPDGAVMGDEAYEHAKQEAHVPSRYPHSWGHSPANPERSYTLLNREAPEYIRFVNPGDLRVADEACGACHAQEVDFVSRSLMSTGSMLWGGAAYNNGILPFKRYMVGEAYTKDGVPAKVQFGRELTDEEIRRGALPYIVPLPAWETIPPADIFRVFERGGRNVLSIFPEIGLPNPFEEPGKPDVRQSNRGPGTGARIAVPVLNIHKTRLNDPFLWFLGTNDNPGDFRSSGCTACHTVYANDRDWFSSGSYAEYGHWGQTVTQDPTIKDRRGPDGELERGHPLRHEFTRAIPSSQCMICHMHQPNVFVNSYLGYTMWDYESDAPHMWPEQQRYPSDAEIRAINDRNPEEAAIRGKWSELAFLSRVWDDVNPKAKDTQFADYHGHGWNFRAIYKRARDGTLLDAEGEAVADDLAPEEKWKRAVHMRDIHADKGMQCADCHFAQDSHGNGFLHGEVAAAVEIRCRDCHGTVDEYATLKTSGPAAPDGGNDLALLRNMDGRRRFVWRAGKLYQRLILPPYEELQVSQVKDVVTAGHPEYNAEAARAKTVAKDDTQNYGAGVAHDDRAHRDDRMACFACHSSWATSCGGCHLPIQANWKTERHHFEGGETRNFATYNPQVVRDQMYQLGVHGEAKDYVIAPVRSSSALVLSSQDINRNRIYVQQPPVSSGGYSSQAFAPHFPHTVRKTETKTCSDCHVSAANDNNAIMAQLLLLGTGFVNFVGFHSWVGTEESVEAIQVTEWDEPQAVIGSYLHRYAYPDSFARHQERGLELDGVPPEMAPRGWWGKLRDWFARGLDYGHHTHHSGRAGCLQLRGEYLYVAEGKKGFRAYDVANIGNKGFAERFVTAPFSPLGQDIRVDSEFATCVALATNQPVRPEWNRREELRKANLEQPMHPIYSYAAITDAKEGLILVNVETLADFEPRNNYLDRALTWNPDGILNGAQHAHYAGHLLYVSAERGVVVVDLDQPLEPKLLTVIPLPGARASAIQFRYLFVVDEMGLRVVDVTNPSQPQVLEDATIPLADAHRLYLARTYAYVAAGSEGLAIVDIERPEAPRLHLKFDADGQLNDAHDVVIGTTNASLFAYVADGRNGLKVVQLTSPDLQPKFYGFSPAPNPQLVAWRKTHAPALSLSRGLDRDRAVDETGHQMAVFGRIGSRPFTLPEMQKLYLDDAGKLWTVSDEPDSSAAAR